MNSTALTNRNFLAKVMFAFTAMVVVFAFVIRFTVYPPAWSDDRLQPNLRVRDSLFGSISVAIQASPNPLEGAGDDEILLSPFTTPTILSPCFFLPTFSRRMPFSGDLVSTTLRAIQHAPSHHSPTCLNSCEPHSIPKNAAFSFGQRPYPYSFS